MPSQLSRSAWSVIGWVTISPPKLSSKISKNSKILAPNFPDFQNFQNFRNFQKVRPYVLENPVHWVGPFRKFWNFWNFWTFWKFQNFQKVRPYVLEKSRPLGLGILEILEYFANFGLVGNFGILGIDFQEG